MKAIILLVAICMAQNSFAGANTASYNCSAELAKIQQARAGIEQAYQQGDYTEAGKKDLLEMQDIAEAAVRIRCFDCNQEQSNLKSQIVALQQQIEENKDGVWTVEEAKLLLQMQVRALQGVGISCGMLQQNRNK